VSASAAVVLLQEAREAGVSLHAESDGRVKVKARLSALLPGLVEQLRAHKPELRELLRGERCRRCGGRIEDRRPGWLAFADGTAAHVACEDRWLAELVRRQAATAFTPEALADTAELMICGGLLP
jgi:hypothetical protein